MQTPNMMKWALIAGVPFGLVSALPLVGCFECCTCFGLIWGSGLFAALLYSQECRRLNAPFDATPGAVLGALTGTINGLTTSIVGMLIGLFFMAGLTVTVPFLEAISDEFSSEELADLLGGTALAGISTLVTFAIGLVINVGIGAVFGTLGGLIGGAIFRVDPAPAAPPVSVQTNDRPDLEA